MMIAHEVWEDFSVEVDVQTEMATITVQVQDGPTGPEAFTIQGNLAMVHRLLHSAVCDLDGQIAEMVKGGALPSSWHDEDDKRADRQQMEDEDA